MEMELANEVHLFVEFNGVIVGNSGIMFYDRAPSKVEQKFAGGLPEQVYLTDKHSIQKVEWDEKVNKPFETVKVRYMDGSNDVTTYILPVKRMEKVLREIDEAIKRGDEKIRIDLSDIRPRKEGRDAREITEELKAGARKTDGIGR